MVAQRPHPGSDRQPAQSTSSWRARTLDAMKTALASSTSDEASAARLGVVHVVQELQECRQRLAVWLLFDSRSLFASLQQPAWCIDNSAARETAFRLGALSQDHDVSVIWVPGHAGLEDNERADAAATTACEHADQSVVPISERALKNAVARSVECEALEAYRTALAGHTHLRASPNAENVSEQVASQIVDLPFWKGNTVIPSGRFPSPLSKTTGSSSDGIPAVSRALRTMSLIAVWRGILPALKRQERGCK